MNNDQPKSGREALVEMDASAMKGTKWQYCAVEFPYDKIQGAVNGFNDLGASGWELVTLLPGLGRHTALFKRQAKRGKS